MGDIYDEYLEELGRSGDEAFKQRMMKRYNEATVRLLMRIKPSGPEPVRVYQGVRDKKGKLKQYFCGYLWRLTFKDGTTTETVARSKKDARDNFAAEMGRKRLPNGSRIEKVMEGE